MSSEISQTDLDSLLRHLPTAASDSRYAVRMENLSGCIFLRINGTLLQPIPDEFTNRLHELFQRSSPQRTVIDLSRCDFISSSAIGVIIEYFRATSEAGGQVLLVQPTPKVVKLVELLGLSSFFLIVENDAMALAYFEEYDRQRG